MGAVAIGSLHSHPSPAASMGARKYKPSGVKGMPSRWTPTMIEAARIAYAGDRPVKCIAADFSTGHSVIHKLARLHRWPRRMSAQGIANLTAARRHRQ